MEAVEADISTYEEQLRQVRSLSLVPNDGGTKQDLEKLETDLVELIELSKETLLQLKKEKLLEELEIEPTNSVKDDSSSAAASVEGTKCRAPWMESTMSTSYHNAIVFASESEDPKMVRVVFSHPTDTRMVPCSFYMKNKCNFSDERCKYSHGELVRLLDLKAFVDPDYENIKQSVENLPILALEPSSMLWRHARLQQYESDDKIHLRFLHGTKGSITTTLENVLPMTDGNDDVDEDDICPAVIQLPWDKIDGSAARLGDWESCTRGIGSKLMSAMGYVHGTGLGKTSEGRVEPIPVTVYPAGRSLDWCMQAKEKSRQSSTSSAVVYLGQKRRGNVKNTVVQKESERPSSDSMFDLINNKLSSERSRPEEPPSASTKHKVNSRRGEDDKETKRRLNVENLKTQEELIKMEKGIDKLERSLNRIKDGGDRSLLLQRLAKMKQHRSQLKDRERSLEASLSQRSKKKLELF